MMINVFRQFREVKDGESVTIYEEDYLSSRIESAIEEVVDDYRKKTDTSNTIVSCNIKVFTYLHRSIENEKKVKKIVSGYTDQCVRCGAPANGELCDSCKKIVMGRDARGAVEATDVSIPKWGEWMRDKKVVAKVPPLLRCGTCLKIPSSDKPRYHINGSLICNDCYAKLRERHFHD